MTDAAILPVPWRRIRPMPNQPREHFDRIALRELAESIAAIGQVVPALAAKVAGDPRHDYELIDGQRRWHAVQLAGLATLRVEVVDEPDAEKRFARSAVANLHRAAHHPMEIARVCDRMKRTMTQEQVAATLGKGLSYVAQHLSLLKLHPDIQGMMHPTTAKAFRLPVAAAVRLAQLPVAKQKEAMAAILAKKGRSFMRAADEVLATMPEAAAPSDELRRPKTPSDTYRTMIVRFGKAADNLRTYAPEAVVAFTAKQPDAREQARKALASVLDLARERLATLEDSR